MTLESLVFAQSHGEHAWQSPTSPTIPHKLAHALITWINDFPEGLRIEYCFMRLHHAVEQCKSINRTMGKDKPAAKSKAAPAGKGKGKDEGDKGVKVSKGAQTINIRHILARDSS